MRAGQVGDVNEIADAGAVRSWIVGTVDLDMRAHAERGLDGDFDQGVAPIVESPVRICGSAPATLK